MLFGGDEVGVIKRHPLISHVPVPPLDPAELMMTPTAGRGPADRAKTDLNLVTTISHSFESYLVERP